MSDFDKEAEREKLREKYGEEEEKRQATEQMSELLLKGATMTNAHCTDCGDPIFRYDGQEFCPTCQKPVARDDADGEQGDHIEVADPSDDATVQFGGDGAAESAGASADTSPPADERSNPDQPTDTAPAGGQPSAADRSSPAGEPQPTDTTREVPSADPTREVPSADPTREVPSADPGRTGDTSGGQPADSRRSPPAPRSRSADDGTGTSLSAAESLLAETVNRFAQRAADTDDPRTAREHLKTAREAAEALDAVRF